MPANLLRRLIVLSEQKLPRLTRHDLVSADEGAPDQAHAAPAKSAFVEPEISAPVDVLEATTFFQAATSGGTN